jgi:hypothetical protein
MIYQDTTRNNFGVQKNLAGLKVISKVQEMEYVLMLKYSAGCSGGISKV